MITEPESFWAFINLYIFQAETNSKPTNSKPIRTKDKTVSITTVQQAIPPKYLGSQDVKNGHRKAYLKYGYM